MTAFHLLFCGSRPTKMQINKTRTRASVTKLWNSHWWKYMKLPSTSCQVLTQQHWSQPSDISKCNSGKGERSVTSVERAEHGLHGAPLSQHLLSPGMSVPSLSRLTSLLKPGPSPKTSQPPPPREPYCRHDPLCPAPPFTRDPAPDSLSLFTRLPFTHTQTRGSDCLRGHAPNIRAKEKKKEQWKGVKARKLFLAQDFHWIWDVRKRWN